MECIKSVQAYWAVRDMDLTTTEVGKYLGLSKSAVSRAADRGQKLIVDQFLSLKDWKRLISTRPPFPMLYSNHSKLRCYRTSNFQSKQIKHRGICKNVCHETDRRRYPAL